MAINVLNPNKMMHVIPLNSNSILVKAVMDALIMWGVDPAKPAETMVKYSSSEAVALGVFAGIPGTFELMTVPPSFIFSAIATSRSNACVLARSLISLVEMTTSERTDGIKWRSDDGIQSIIFAIASRRSYAIVSM